MARTIGSLLTEARVILQDQESGAYRFPDADLIQAFNGALLEAKTKRPDLFLGMGLRTAVPTYDAVADLTTAFPLDDVAYTPILYYIVGRTELRESTYSDDSRAVSLMNKFVSQLTGVIS